MIAGLQFIVTNGISGTSTSTYCGTKNGLSAYIGRAGKAVGALGGTCSTGTTVGPSTAFTIDGNTVTPSNATNGTLAKRRLRRALLAASLEN